MGTSKRKMPLVDNYCGKKKSVRAEDQKSSHPDTEHKSNTADNRSSKGGNRKPQIRTEPCRSNPGGSIVRERFKFNFFCLSRTTSCSRRRHGRGCPNWRHPAATPLHSCSMASLCLCYQKFQASCFFGNQFWLNRNSVCRGRFI